YEKTASADSSRAGAIRRVLASYPHQEARSPYASVIASDVPKLDHSAFVAMIGQLFTDETGSAPHEITVSQATLRREYKGASKGMQSRLDGDARALRRSAQLLSIKCSCAADAVLIGETAGGALLKARFETSFKAPEVGLPQAVQLFHERATCTTARFSRNINQLATMSATRTTRPSADGIRT